MSINPSTMRMGVVAILVGLVGSYGVRKVMEEEEAPAAPPPAVQLVVPLASTELPAGRIIQLGDVALVQMTRDTMKERNFPESAVMMSAEQIIGRRLRHPIRRSDPFLTTDFHLSGYVDDPRANLKHGYQAVNVPVPAANCMHVDAGDTVDVLFRTTPVAAKDGQLGIPEMTKVLMTGVEVLSVNRQDSPDLARLGIDNNPVIMLAVTPEQAAKFHVVKGKGEIALTIRSAGDLAIMNDAEQQLTFDDVMGIQRTEPQQQPIWETVYYRGRNPNALQFPIAMPKQPSAQVPPHGAIDPRATVNPGDADQQASVAPHGYSGPYRPQPETSNPFRDEDATPLEVMP